MRSSGPDAIQHIPAISSSNGVWMQSSDRSMQSGGMLLGCTQTPVCKTGCMVIAAIGTHGHPNDQESM